MYRLNLYTTESNKQVANDFLVSEFGEDARDTFGVPRTKDGVTYLTCSWYLEDEKAEIISALMPETIMENLDGFKDFGYIEEENAI